jgi:ATP-dependent exoDNAse (exonuclease V) alpha subunit
MTKKWRKPTDEAQLKLRFEERLRRRLEQSATWYSRSLNAEIIHRLERSLEAEKTGHRERQREPSKMFQLVTAINEKLDKLLAEKEHKVGQLDEASAIIADIVREHETRVATKTADEWDPKKVARLEPRTTGAPAQGPLKREGEK